MWELTDGRIDRCLAVLSAFLKTFAHAQPRRLEAALRVLYELSVAENYLDCELAEVASLPELENLTKNLHKNSNMLTKAALDTPVIEAAVNALRPMVALLGPIREGDGEYDAGEDLAVFLSSIESLLSFVHNLLLFSTESTMQLRKHLTKTRLFEDVLMPYTTALIHSSLVSGARRRLKLKQLLRALTILTCKIAVFRQVFANPQGISMILLITHCCFRSEASWTSRQDLLANNPALVVLPDADLCDAELVHLLARLNCNLEIIQSAKQSKQLAETCAAVQRFFFCRWQTARSDAYPIKWSPMGCCLSPGSHTDPTDYLDPID